MDIHGHARVHAVLGAAFAVMVVLAGLSTLATGLLSDGDEMLVAERMRLEMAFDHLGFARAFAYGDVMEAAAGALAKLY